MPQVTDKHYNDFGGLDTATNRLKMNPKTQRRGSKNWRYNYDDQYTQRNGFQHKTEDIDGFRYGIAEYKFRDINTGESKTQILGVGADGFLYKKRFDRLKMVRTSGSAVQYYSVYYNELIDDWTFTLFDSNQAVLFTIDFDELYTLDDLAADINTAAIPNFAASVVDEDGNILVNTVAAYLLQTTILEEFNTTGTDTEYNEGWYQEVIPSPSNDPLFPEVLDNAITSLPDFEGLTYQNLNNAIYMTCGGHLVKYDGFTAYRAGVPAVLPPDLPNVGNFSGISILSSTATGGNLVTGTYYYKFKFGYVDPNGAEYLGEDLVNSELGGSQLFATLSGANNSVTITYYGFVNDSRFPVYAAKVNGDQDIPLIGGTFNVDSGHNITAGMIIQIPILNTASLLGGAGYSYILSKVASVTATTITVESGFVGDNPFVPSATTLLTDNQILQAGFREDALDNTITDISNASTPSLFHPPTICGMFLRVYRTKLDQSLGPWYHVVDLPLPTSSMGSTTFIDRLADTNIVTELDESEGGPLPRAGRYISVWQQQLVQGGRPYDTLLKDDYYPSYFTNVDPTNDWGLTSTSFQFYKVTEAGLCDFQSVYWTDPLNSEAFPNDGSSEEDFQGKFQDQVRGFSENKDALFVLKDRTVGLLTGTVATGDLSKEILETDAGCSSHNSIQEVAGSLVWLDGVGGFWSCVAGRLPEYVGAIIQDDFRKNLQKSRNQRFLPSRAKATNFRLDNQYICFIPAGWIEDGEVEASADPTTYSLMFVFDYSTGEGKQRNCWYQWQDVYPNAGILSSAQDELILAEFREGESRLWKQKRTSTRFDMSDHKSAIEMKILSAWLNYGAPTIDKDFVNCWVNSVEGGFDLRADQYYNYNDTLQSSFDMTFPAQASTQVTVKQDANLNIPKLSAISIGFYNNEKNQLVKIDGFEVIYAADFDLGEPKK